MFMAKNITIAFDADGANIIGLRNRTTGTMLTPAEADALARKQAPAAKAVSLSQFSLIAEACCHGTQYGGYALRVWLGSVGIAGCPQVATRLLHCHRFTWTLLSVLRARL